MTSRPLPEWLQTKLAGLPPAERAEEVELYQELATADEECRQQAADLAAFERLNDLIRDRVVQAARRYHTSIYIVGRPGTGKTHVIQDTLAGLGDGVRWTYSEGHVTPPALFELLRDRPDDVHVIDDVPKLYRQPQGQQILMAALGGDPGKPRRVTYSTKGRPQQIEFRGSVVAVSNLPLGADPLARAVESRSVVLVHEPTDAMLVAKLRVLAEGGYKDLSREACREVAEFVLAESRASGYRIDLRFLGKGLGDYSYCRDCRAYTSWQELVRSSLRKLLAEDEAQVRPFTRAGRKGAEHELVRELLAKYPGHTPEQATKRLEEWASRTNKARDSYYRRLRELGYEEGRPPPAEPAPPSPVAAPPQPATSTDDRVEQAARTLGVPAETLRGLLARSGHLPATPP